LTVLLSKRALRKLFIGYRNGKFDWYLEKWEGLENKDEQD